MLATSLFAVAEQATAPDATPDARAVIMMDLDTLGAAYGVPVLKQLCAEHVTELRVYATATNALAEQATHTVPCSLPDAAALRIVWDSAILTHGAGAARVLILTLDGFSDTLASLEPQVDSAAPTTLLSSFWQQRLGGAKSVSAIPGAETIPAPAAPAVPVAPGTGTLGKHPREESEAVDPDAVPGGPKAKKKHPRKEKAAAGPGPGETWEVDAGKPGKDPVCLLQEMTHVSRALAVRYDHSIVSGQGTRLPVHGCVCSARLRYDLPAGQLDPSAAGVSTEVNQ